MTTPECESFLVDFPGYIGKDPAEAVRALGGLEKVAKAFSGAMDTPDTQHPRQSTATIMAKGKAALELRMRPDNPYCHPIRGQVVPYCALVIRLRWKRNRADGTRELVGSEAVAAVERIGRFREMADYQVHADMAGPVPKLCAKLRQMDIDYVEKHGFPVDEQDRNAIPLAPLYSRIQVPFHYDFKLNPGVQKIVVNEQQVRLIHRDRVGRNLDIPDVHFEDAELPTGPPEGLPPIDPNMDARLRQLFEQRPIWTRHAIVLELGISATPELRCMLLRHGYFQANGPWRACYIRYGYDPRKTSDSRKYQIVDFRTNLVSRPLAPRRAAMHSSLLDRIPESAKLTGAVAADKPVEQQVGRGYQLCDIEEPTIANIINMEGLVRPECSIQDGWYYHYHMKTIRILIKHVVRDLLAQESLRKKEMEKGATSENPVENEGTPGVLRFHLEEAVRRNLEEQLQRNIRDTCLLKEVADRDTINERLNQLMGKMAELSGSARGVIEQEDDDDYTGAEDDLEYDLLAD